MARSARDYHDLAVEYGIKSPGMSGQSQQWRDRVDNVHSNAQRTRKVDPAMVADASAHGYRARKQLDASALAHTPPPDMGRSRRPTGDHDPRRYDWANDPNVGKD